MFPAFGAFTVQVALVWPSVPLVVLPLPTLPCWTTCRAVKVVLNVVLVNGVCAASLPTRLSNPMLLACGLVEGSGATTGPEPVFWAPPLNALGLTPNAKLVGLPAVGVRGAVAAEDTGLVHDRA